MEKSASCDLHRVSEAYRPHPPFSAHFEHILLGIVSIRLFFRRWSTLFSTFITSLSFKALLTRRPLLFAPQMGSFLHGMPSKGMAAVLFLPAAMRDAGEGHGRVLKVFISSFFFQRCLELKFNLFLHFKIECRHLPPFPLHRTLGHLN